MVKTTKGGKVMNPTDAYRKELRKKEIKRNKKERKKVREVGLLKKDPNQIKEQIQKLDIMKAEGALDKARKHKKRQLEDTLNMVMKKRKEYEENMKEKCEELVMFSHLGPVHHRISSEEEERANHPKPEDSVYYHPTLNPTGAPPHGKPPMYNSSIGLQVPLSKAASSGGQSSSMGPDVELPAPPPPPPLPKTGDPEFINGLDISASLPLPPPPPMPTKPPGSNLGASLPLPPPPPPPPGPPPREQIGGASPPLTLQQTMQPPPLGTVGNTQDDNRSDVPDGTGPNVVQAPNMLPPPPSAPGLPPKSAGNESALEPDAKSQSETKDSSKMVMLPPPLPPPPRQHTIPGVAGPVALGTLQPDVLPPGISRFPPPPPDMRPSLSAPGIPGQPAPPGMAHLMPRPPYGPPPGPPPMMRPPLPPGPPPMMQPNDQAGIRLTAPQKPSFVKSAAPTVIKRPLAQHTPELTAMIPASVRVRRESALPKPKPKSLVSSTTVIQQPSHSTPKPEPVNPAAPKAQSIDDSYMAFLEDMKQLGALDG